MEGERGWDIDLVNDIFSPRDRALIQKIHLSLSEEADKWQWVDDVKGVYTVKNGYRCLTKNRSQQARFAGLINWKSLWRLQIPPKVRIFVWRVTTGCLLTLIALTSRMVDTSLMCPVCNLDYETSYHALVGCVSARHVWRLSHLGDNHRLVGNLSGGTR